MSVGNGSIPKQANYPQTKSLWVYKLSSACADSIGSAPGKLCLCSQDFNRQVFLQKWDVSVENQVLSVSSQTFCHKLKELDLEAIAHQLIQYGWTWQQTTRAIIRYKMFLSLVYLHPHKLLVPTQEIDFVWHRHILHTRKYSQDCQMLFGRFIHHEPDSIMWRQADQLSWDAAFAQTQTLFEYYFPLAALEDTQLEQLDDIFLAENPLQQPNIGEKGDLRFQRSACGRPSFVDLTQGS